MIEIPLSGAGDCVVNQPLHCQVAPAGCAHRLLSKSFLHRPFVAAFIAFAIAQVTKLFTFYYTENRWDYTRIVGSGGMPSSHTAMVRPRPAPPSAFS